MADAAFTAAQRLTAASLNAQFNKVRWRVQKSTQSVTNSTTLVASNDLTFSVEANASYIFSSQIVYIAGTSSNFNLGFNMPGGSTFNFSAWCNSIGGNTSSSPIFHDWITTNPVPFGGGGTTTLTARPSGVLTTGNTPGTFVWTFAQNTAASTSSAQLCAGSWVMLTKVS